MKVGENMIVSFFCKASGHPAPTYSWEKTGNPINHVHRKRYDVYSMPNGGTVPRVTKAVSKRDDTYFTCVAKNSIGEARANATLEVYPAESEFYTLLLLLQVEKIIFLILLVIFLFMWWQCNCFWAFFANSWKTRDIAEKLNNTSNLKVIFLLSIKPKAIFFIDMIDSQ